MLYCYLLLHVWNTGYIHTNQFITTVLLFPKNTGRHTESGTLHTKNAHAKHMNQQTSLTGTLLGVAGVNSHKL